MDKKEAAALRLKERTTSKRFKLPEGTTTFRVLPNARGLDEKEYIEYAMHSNVGARKGYLRCGKNVRGKGECWLCDSLIPKLAKSTSASNRKSAEEMRRKECFAIQIAYVSEGKWAGPVLWEMTPSLANKLLGVMARRNISHPEEGYNLSITRTGTTMTATRYSDIDRDDEKSPVKPSILSQLKPFGEQLRKYDEARQKQEYFGHEQEEENTSGEPDDAEEEAATKPVRRAAVAEEDAEEVVAKPAKKPARPAPDVDENDEPVEDDEPVAKPVKKPKPAPVEEEEETETEAAVEDDDIPYLEEEDDTPPAKPAAKAGKGKTSRPVADEEEETVEEEEVKPKAGKGKARPVEVDEDEEPQPKAKPGKKPRPVDVDEDE